MLQQLQQSCMLSVLRLMLVKFRTKLVLVEVRWEERVNRAVHIADLGATPRA